SIVDEQPVLLAGPVPTYPDLLRQAGIQGRVVLAAVVDTLGRIEPRSFTVVSATHPGFVAPAQQALAASVFRPARMRGRAVRVRVEAWVLLGVVGFYQQGDSAAAQAFRQALALDPGLQATALDRFDPALPQILAVERAALPSRAAPAPPVGAAIRDCLRK